VWEGERGLPLAAICWPPFSPLQQTCTAQEVRRVKEAMRNEAMRTLREAVKEPPMAACGGSQGAVKAVKEPPMAACRASTSQVSVSLLQLSVSVSLFLCLFLSLSLCVYNTKVFLYVNIYQHAHGVCLCAFVFVCLCVWCVCGVWWHRQEGVEVHAGGLVRIHSLERATEHNGAVGKAEG